MKKININSIEHNLNTKQKYIDLLGLEQTLKILDIFANIEKGVYDKNKIYSFKLNTLKFPIYFRSIRADMQSFINTFIDCYLEKKPYLANCNYVVDAGGNIGFTAILFANWWPESNIISLEPDYENYNLILKNALNYPNIKVVNSGLWNKEINLKIEAGQEDGFVLKEISNNQTEIKPENLTKGVSIESLMIKYSFPHIDFLKMNIEGSEKEVFSENYEYWISKTNTMLIELHDGKNAGCSKSVFTTTNLYNFSVAETAQYGILFVQETIYRKWYSNWYKEEIYKPNIDKIRFPDFYLDKE